MANEIVVKASTDTQTLCEVLKKINSNSQSENFTFFYQNYEIQKNLQELTIEFPKKDIFSDKTLNITFYEDDIFDVKPITRISSSLEGHTEAVL